MDNASESSQGLPIMAEIHSLIRQHGRDVARAFVDPEQRVLIDVAAEVLGIEEPSVGVVYTGFALTSLPHRQIPQDDSWEQVNGPVRLVVSPGSLPGPNGQDIKFGVPYGAAARLILIYLQTQAVRTQSREIEVGRSLREFMTRLGMPDGGKNYKLLREQLARIAACSLRFSWKEDADSPATFMKSDIIKGGRLDLSFAAPDTRQGRFWEDRVVLGEDFFATLQKHPVPLVEQALRSIGSQSLALDIYVWLAYRLHVLKAPTPISWAALHQQFGAGYARVRDFKRYFQQPLQLALAAYPEAVVEVEDGGLRLYPSSPPIAKR